MDHRVKGRYLCLRHLPGKSPLSTAMHHRPLACLQSVFQSIVYAMDYVGFWLDPAALRFPGLRLDPEAITGVSIPIRSTKTKLCVLSIVGL